MTGPHLHLDSSVGCVFVGTLFATLLYGCTCGQGMYYISEYPDDHRIVKALVFILWGLDTTTVIADSMLLWDYVVGGRQNPTVLSTMPTIGSLHHLFSGTTIYLVQLYYVHTIWRLVHHKWWRASLMGILVMLSSATYAFAIAIVYLSLQHQTIAGLYDTVRLESIVQPTISCIADICITVSLSCLLRIRRDRVAFRSSRTDTLLRRLMIYAINRGAFTALVQSLQVIMYVSSDTSVFYWALFYFPGCKVYVNSTLAILNARHYIRRGGQEYLSTGFEMQEYPAARAPMIYAPQEVSLSEQVTASSGAIIKVTTEVIQQVE